MKIRVIDVDNMNIEDYVQDIIYMSKEKKRYSFMSKCGADFQVGMGRGDVPRSHPQYAKDTGLMTFKQAQRVMYDFMRGE